MDPMDSTTYKEIFQQPQAFLAVNQDLELIRQTVQDVFSRRKIGQVIFTGCGTSLYLAQTAAALFSHYNSVKAQAVPCSELYFHPQLYIGGGETLVCPITRKSVTTEVRLAIKRVHEFPNVQSLAITCCSGSREYNEDMILSSDANEDSVVMTKSFTSMVYLCAILAMTAGGRDGELEQMAAEIPGLCRRALPDLDSLARRILAEHPKTNLYITLGQGVFYGIANECMNKEKEMSLSNSESYYTLEYRHGPMSLVDENTLILQLASQDTGNYESGLLREMKEKGAAVAVFGEKASGLWDFADYAYFAESGLNDLQLSPVAVLLGQLLGYHAARSKGLNPDSPRHLSQAIVIS